jgi:hypothetical protein
MPTGIYGCTHYQYKWKKQCDNQVWIDESGKKHKRCQEHICVFCHGNVKSKNKREKEIGSNNQGPLYYCKNEPGKDCVKKVNRVISENSKVRAKLANYREPFFDKLKANLLVDPKFLTELRPFFNDLWGRQVYLLQSNYFEVPTFADWMLETIKGLIEGANCLNDHEKNNLKLAYTKAGGDIENTISELDENLTNIGKARKIRKDLEKAAQEQQKEAIERNNYSKKLENLDGWNLLGGNEKINYLQQIKSFPISSLDSVIHNAQATIKKMKTLIPERERERERESKPPTTQWEKFGPTGPQCSFSPKPSPEIHW